MADSGSQPASLQPGVNVRLSASQPSEIHPAHREVEAPDNPVTHPHSVPMVNERLSNKYFGHWVDGDWTEKHGILYSVEGRAFPGGLGDAIAWCIQNPKQPVPEVSAAPVAPVAVVTPESTSATGPVEAPVVDAEAAVVTPATEASLPDATTATTEVA